MKAVVLEAQGREAVLLLGDGTVRRVYGHYEVGQTLDYRPRTGRAAVKWVASVAASVMLLGLSGGLWAQRNLVACAEVSLDVNPSIVYTLNRRDRVLSVRAVNTDAEAVVAALGTEVRFEPLSEAVSQTLKLLADDGYLDAEQDDYVLVNVSADDEARQASLTQQAEVALNDTQQSDASLNYRIDHSDRATAKAAEDNGVSVGRYAAWQAEQADGGAPELKDFAECPVSRILSGPDHAPEAPAEALPEKRMGEFPENPVGEVPDKPVEQANERPAEEAPLLPDAPVESPSTTMPEPNEAEMPSQRDSAPVPENIPQGGAPNGDNAPPAENAPQGGAPNGDNAPKKEEPSGGRAEPRGGMSPNDGGRP